MENQKEITQMKNRFKELAERSHRQGVFTFTGFLGLGEMDIFWQQESSSPTQVFTWTAVIRKRTVA